MSSGRVYFDISSLTRTIAESHSMTSATRVDYHVVSHYLQQPAVCFVKWAKEQQQLVSVDKQQVERMLKQVDARNHTATQTAHSSHHAAELVSIEIYTDASYRNTWRGQSGFAHAIVKLCNLGVEAWLQSETSLTTSLPYKRSSSISHQGWLKPSRPAQLEDLVVRPQQVGTFRFPITIPEGPTEEFFNLVIGHESYVLTGRIRLQLTEHAGTALKHRLALFKIKVANRLILLREVWARQVGLTGKLQLVVGEFINIAKTRLKHTWLVRKNKRLCLKILGFGPTISTVSRRACRFLGQLDQFIAASRRVLASKLLLPTPKFY